MNRRDWLRNGLLAPALALTVSTPACTKRKSPRYQGYALIASSNSRTLSIIDLSRFQRLQAVTLDSAPLRVIAVPDATRAYIAGADSPVMDVLNLETLRLEKPTPLGAKPRDAILSPDRRSIWVLAQEPNQLLGFDAASGARHTRIALPWAGDDLDAQGDRIAIAFRQERRVGCYRVTEKRFDGSPALNAAPHFVKLRWDSQLILAANTEDRSITTIDAASLQPQVNLPLAVAPEHFCFNNDGGQLFVTGQGMDAVVIVSPYQSEVNETILAGNAPGNMAITSAAPNYLFVANPKSGDITVINIDNRRVLAQIPVGQAPASVLVTPDNEYALVLNEQSGDVAVIRLLNIREANASSRRNRMASLFTLIAVGSAPVSGVVVPRPG